MSGHPPSDLGLPESRPPAVRRLTEIGSPRGVQTVGGCPESKLGRRSPVSGHRVHEVPAAHLGRPFPQPAGFTLLALTANTMMESVRGRIAEFAVLKTFGYSNDVIAVLVVLEAMLLCLAAAVCGLALAALAFPALIERLGLGAISLPMPVIGAGFAIAVCLALVSALPPVWRALRLDVAAALAAH